MTTEWETYKITRSKNFSHEEIVSLIQVWGDDLMQDRFESSYRHSNIWETITKLLKNRGYVRTKDEWKTKIGNLKCQYFKLKKNASTDSSSAAFDWPYWNLMNDIYSKKDNCKDLVDELEAEENEIKEMKSENEIVLPDCPGYIVAQSEPKHSQNSAKDDLKSIEDSSEIQITTIAGKTTTNSKRKREEDFDPFINKAIEIEEERLRLMKRRTDEECKMFQAATDYFKSLNSNLSSHEGKNTLHTFQSSFMTNVCPGLHTVQVPSISLPVPFGCASFQSPCCCSRVKSNAETTSNNLPKTE